MAKLNAQGLSRKNKELMEVLEAEPGYVFVSCDLSAGEPTVVSHFSQDKNYMSACFDMVGKKPYYTQYGILKIDDIYLMVMSVSPIGQQKMYEAFCHTTYDGLSFEDQWLKDPEVIKKALKSERALHKILCLGLAYSMGPKHLRESAFIAGYEISLAQAKAFYKAYWELFKDVKRLGTVLEAKLSTQGYLINPFGFRLIPDKPYKSLNYFIQSSVTGIMHVLCAKYFSDECKAQFVTVIHDEIILRMPIEAAEECRLRMKEAEASLNADLGWSVNIRVGWAVGANLYEAK